MDQNGKKRDWILWITIAILFGIATGEFGFICGRWNRPIPSFDYDVRLLEHETKIQVLQSEMRLIRDKLRMP